MTNVKNEFGLLPENIQDTIAARRLICAECPFNSENAKKDGLYESERPDAHCILCSCNIHTKTACLDCICGIDVYNQDKEEKDKLEIKWDKYERH
jgi:hypothetical protein